METENKKKPNTLTFKNSSYAETDSARENNGRVVQ